MKSILVIDSRCSIQVQEAEKMTLSHGQSHTTIPVDIGGNTMASVTTMYQMINSKINLCKINSLPNMQWKP